MKNEVEIIIKNSPSNIPDVFLRFNNLEFKSFFNAMLDLEEQLKYDYKYMDDEKIDFHVNAIIRRFQEFKKKRTTYV